ncbi:MAG: two-component sensor histidine kinase [Rhodobacteraceae bacterium]|nr:two-component sensor histidine kinase [Paracoccaceae bacterium]MCF8513093.1 two-component sensor histidine kinase [Paracoccaceae bacterium]MCF8517337.1 two-component sensor histidine kinase [Paracoccaceae bacterium]
MLIAAIVVAVWVSGRIEAVVVRNTANSTALFMESFIAPLMQDLTKANELSQESRLEIGRLIKETALGERVVSFKLWREDGLLVDASNTELVGQRFEVTENLRLAWTGNVMADFEDTQDPEDVAENALGVPLMEVYSPIREIGSGRVIAVAEFYEIATQLKSDLIQARLASWLAVAVLMAAIGGSLFIIVLRGSLTIDRQLAALQEMSTKNLSLRRRVQGAAVRFSAMNDSALQQIGTDLHDGPAQMMGYAALRIDALRGHISGAQGQAELDAVEQAIRSAMTEIRNMSRGLSLPDIDRKSMSALLDALAASLSERFDVPIAVFVEMDREDLPRAIKLCLYRMAREGLNNGWRHADGKGLALRLNVQEGQLVFSVLDEGEAPATDIDATEGLGLAGLRDRVESLGGQLSLLRRRLGGHELRMTLDIREVE